MTAVTNVATVRNFEVMFDEFSVVEILISGNNAN